MKNLVSSYVDQFRQDRQKQIKLVAVLAALAVVVAGIVFWQLHSTGVAMTNETFCGMEEHTHGDECYEEVLICDNDDEDHVHSDECYARMLVCDKAEHTHTIECMIDENADLETAADWEATLPALTGNQAYDVVSIAQSQVGYSESEANFQLADDGVTRLGYTRYGEWYGNAYGDWDAMFASFCLNYADVSETEFPESSGVYAWMTDLEQDGLLVESGFTPSRGDLVFLDTDQNGEADTVAIVTGEDDGILTVIQGNSNDVVEQYEIAAADSGIVAYGILPAQEDAPEVNFETLDSVTEAIAEEEASGEDADDAGIQTLANEQKDALDGDYAYLSGVGLATGSNQNGMAMTTGTAPWDSDDEAGNDSGADNDVLRTFDTATYELTMQTHTNDENTYKTGKLYFEFIVEGSASEVQWETGSMGWLESKHGLYTETTETHGGQEYQVLRGYVTLEPATDDGHAIGETTQSLSLVLRALAMQDEQQLIPKFTVFLEYNDVGLTADQYAAWGTESYNGPMITFDGKDCEEHKTQEYQTCTAPEITISARPMYNLAIVNSTESKTQAMGNYDFSTGNDLALNKDAGDKYGRLGSFGLVLQIVGKNESEGLRGAQLPKEGESLSISFTLNISSTYKANDTVYTTGTNDNPGGADLTKYAPLVWSFDQNKSGSSQQDNRTISTSTKYADQVPYNKLGVTSDAYWYDSCNDGGGWKITDNQDGTFTVTITECDVDMGQLPYVHPGAGTSLSYRYYNPNNINYSPNDDTKNDYWAVQTACLSAGELWVVQPYYAGGKDDATYIAGMLGEGTFTLTVSDSVLDVQQGGETLNSGNSQSVESDDSQGQSMELVNPGNIDMHVAYVKYDYAAYNDALTDGCFSSDKDWILQGDKLCLEDYLTNDSAEEGNTGVAYDVMIKFDDAFFEPEGTIKHSGYLNNETRSDLWAAKPDGTGWSHTDESGNTLKPDEDGYDSEMINATPDDLIYYSSLDELKADGKICVGVLVQYRGVMTEQQNHLHTYVLGTSKTDCDSDQVYMITHYGRAWDRDDLAAAMAEDPESEYYGSESKALSALLAMSTDEVKTVVNKYIPTRTATQNYTYENETGSENVDYPSAHWVNGDRRHPTEAAGGSSRTPTILNYVKCKYDENGCHSGSSGNYWGDSCLAVAYKSGLTMEVVQPTIGGDGSEHSKSVFDMDTAQTVVDYEISPFISRNNGEQSYETLTTTDVVVTVTLPENLSYITGSSYIGGTYSTNGEGKQGTVTGGVQLTEGTETTITMNVNGKDYTVKVLLTHQVIDGVDVLTYTFTDVPVTGTELIQYLENIYYSCEISSGAVSNGTELDVTADISCTSDQGIEPTMRDDGEAIVGITVTKNTAISLVKTADHTAVDVNDELGYTIDVGDNSDNAMTMVAVDNIPYNGDGSSTFINDDCDVYVTEFSAYDVTSTRDLSGFYFFYTTKKEFAGMTSKDYPEGEYFVTDLGEETAAVNQQCIDAGWVLMNMSDEGEDAAGHEFYDFTDFPEDKQVYAIVGIGIVEGNDDINLHVTLKLSNADAGDSVVNKITQQHATTTTNEQGETVKTYDDLSDNARVRVVGRVISGFVWLDEDMDGGMRTGMYKNEQLLKGVQVVLQTQDSSGNWVTARKLKVDDTNKLDADSDPYDCITYTDKNGYYEFTYVPAGNFRMWFSGEGIGDGSGLSYTLADNDVTTFKAEGISDSANSKVQRHDEYYTDYISGITLAAATDIPGDWDYTLYENAGYTKNVPFTVNKVWLDVDGNDITADKKTGSVTVKITASPDGTEETLVMEPTLDPSNDWKYENKDLPYYDGKGGELNYSAASFTVEEIDGNDGYSMSVGDIIENDDGSYSVTVTNQPSIEMPYTGGSGTWMYTVAGLLLIGGAAAALVYRKRRAVKS